LIPIKYTPESVYKFGIDRITEENYSIQDQKRANV